MSLLLKAFVGTFLLSVISEYSFASARKVADASEEVASEEVVPPKGAKKKKKKKKKKKAKEVAAVDESGEENSEEETTDSVPSSMGASELNRQNKTVEIGAELAGFLLNYTSGIYGGFYLTPNQVLTLRYNQGMTFSDGDSMSAMSANLKSFWGNSFYTVVGIGSRSYEYNHSEKSIFDTTEDEGDIETYKISASSIGLEAGIGNQWTFGAFTLGTDWVGVWVPLSTSGTELETEEYYDSRNLSYENISNDVDYIKAVQPMFVRLYLGISF